MAVTTAGIWLCLLAALSLAAANSTHETSPAGCSSESRLLEKLTADLRVVLDCGDNLVSSWSPQQRAAVLLSLTNLTESLSQHQLRETNKCPVAKVPDNGGLVCVTVSNKRYCKPLCNYGYDFGFLRRSRLYEECGEQTQHRWTTQYIGGNTLAVCQEASIQVSGAQSAYFPKDQDCQTTKSSIQLQNNLTDTFEAELKQKGVQGPPESPSLVCGKL